MVSLNITDHSALVTASSSGLGKASAKALARHGANVVINGRDATKLDAAVEEIREVAEGEVIGVVGDLTDPAAIDNLVATTIQEFGGLDHLITSTGGPARYHFHETTDKDWYAAYDLLVMSVIRVIDQVLEVLCDGEHGSIVMITSRLVKEASPTNILSSSVRMSLVGLEKSLSKEYGPDVRTNALLPGPHNTPRRNDPGQASVSDVDSIPVRQMGDPDHFGEFAAYLSSPKASFINGVAIPIDGGIGNSNL